MATFISEYGEFIIVVLALVSSLIGFIIACIKARKNGKSVSLFTLLSKIPTYVSEAEKLFPSTGNVKAGLLRKTYVLTKLRTDCCDEGIKYDEALFSSEIESVLSTPQKKTIEEVNHETKTYAPK